MEYADIYEDEKMVNLMMRAAASSSVDIDFMCFLFKEVPAYIAQLRAKSKTWIIMILEKQLMLEP